MLTNPKEYIEELISIINADGYLNHLTNKTIELIKTQSSKGHKVIIIGNGGSASIANHLALDLWNNDGIKAMTFSESSMLTCVSNDEGYRNVYAVPIKMFANSGDVLIAISSSGESDNIINGVFAAIDMGCKIITMSGFRDRNTLRSLGEINFYIPSSYYGYVELAHSILCHYISDMLGKDK